MPKRLQNQLYVGYPLGALKNTIFEVKTSPRWTPKISDFFQKSLKNCTYHGLCSKMPLGSLQEPAKSLPGASQEPFNGPQEAPKSLPEAPYSLLGAFSEAPKRPVPCSRCSMSGARYQVSGARCQVCGRQAIGSHSKQTNKHNWFLLLQGGNASASVHNLTHTAHQKKQRGRRIGVRLLDRLIVVVVVLLLLVLVVVVVVEGID